MILKTCTAQVRDFGRHINVGNIQVFREVLCAAALSQLGVHGPVLPGNPCKACISPIACSSACTVSAIVKGAAMYLDPWNLVNPTASAMVIARATSLAADTQLALHGARV